jgi:hypothetical protein
VRCGAVRCVACVRDGDGQSSVSGGGFLTKRGSFLAIYAGGVDGPAQGSGSSGITAFSGGARERGTWRQLGRDWEGRRSIEEHCGGGGQVGQLEPAAGVGKLGRPMTGRPRFLRAAAMPGLLALDGRLAPTSLGRSATDLLETPKEGGRGRAGALGKPPSVGTG